MEHQTQHRLFPIFLYLSTHFPKNVSTPPPPTHKKISPLHDLKAEIRFLRISMKLPLSLSEKLIIHIGENYSEVREINYSTKMSTAAHRTWQIYIFSLKKMFAERLKAHVSRVFFSVQKKNTHRLIILVSWDCYVDYHGLFKKILL